MVKSPQDQKNNFHHEGHEEHEEEEEMKNSRRLQKGIWLQMSSVLFWTRCSDGQSPYIQSHIRQRDPTVSSFVFFHSLFFVLGVAFVVINFLVATKGCAGAFRISCASFAFARIVC